MSRALRYLSWAFRVVVFVLLFAFALKNSDPVVVRFYFGAQWEASLALVLLVFFAVGAAAGVFACFAYIYRQRREILSLRKEARARPGPPEVSP
ncbi:MAG TPA: LapA family protein [Burkholderiales bacterium]|nr:LapA family protein [Burkholderiales bacterium]